MAASLGKIPTTSVRRLISPLSGQLLPDGSPQVRVGHAVFVLVGQEIPESGRLAPRPRWIERQKVDRPPEFLDRLANADEVALNGVLPLFVGEIGFHGVERRPRADQGDSTTSVADDFGRGSLSPIRRH